MKKCDQIIRLLKDLSSDSKKEDIREWASKAVYAVENEAVHDLWSDVITEPVNLLDMQQLSDGVVDGNDGLKRLELTRRYVVSLMKCVFFAPDKQLSPQ